ncbi:MAG: DUF488 domain-containing protein [Thermodesulfobacteriota bacterium]
MLPDVARTVYTAGHSSLTSDAFLELLERAGVTRLVDVRAFPGSRRHPQFGRAALAAECARHAIDYRWMPGLGGRRRSTGDRSPHRAWTVDAFRAYADYADTPEFAAALAELERLAAARPTAIACAEALWWQCHRRLIADRLLVAGWRVVHLGRDAPAEHRLPEFARVVDGRILYDGGTTDPLL